MWKAIKKMLSKLGAMLLRKYGADALVAVQGKAYEKGKKSKAYAKIMEISTDLGKVAKMIGTAGADGKFTDAEKADAKIVWAGILEKLASVLDEAAE